MEKFSPHCFKRYLPILTVVAIVAAVFWLGSGGPVTVEAKLSQGTAALAQRASTFHSSDPRLQKALSAQRLSTPQLLSQPDVIGTAAGVNNVDEPTVMVLLRKKVPTGVLPTHVNGVPLQLKVTGKILAMEASEVYPRPVPIGVSVGNKFECSAGTIGAKVKDAQNNVYALSNNHVLALENTAPINSRVVQPGLFDTPNCAFTKVNIIGALYDFEPIIFSPSANNIMDAAIAKTTRFKLSRKTLPDGYGLPKATTVPPAVGQRVQKYGRTTLRTLGAITGVNAVVLVTYESGEAQFVDQIIVESTSPFLLPGDSGSLLVTYPKRNPVGLLFAGDTTTGKLAVANPIDPILERFGVTIDGILPKASSSGKTPAIDTHGRVLAGAAG